MRNCFEINHLNFLNAQSCARSNRSYICKQAVADKTCWMVENQQDNIYDIYPSRQSTGKSTSNQGTFVPRLLTTNFCRRTLILRVHARWLMSRESRHAWSCNSTYILSPPQESWKVVRAATPELQCTHDLFTHRPLHDMPLAQVSKTGVIWTTKGACRPEEKSFGQRTAFFFNS